MRKPLLQGGGFFKGRFLFGAVFLRQLFLPTTTKLQ